MRTATFLLLLPLAGCLRAEREIDRSLVQGAVRVPAEPVDEKADANNGLPDFAQKLEPLRHATRLVNGKMRSFGTTEEGDVTGDIDWFALNVDEDTTVSVTLTWAETRTMRVGLYNLDETIPPAGNPTLIDATDIAGTTGELSWDLTGGVNYAIRVAGLEGDSGIDYTIALQGAHPDDAGVLVGAWASNDVTARGALYGGTSVRGFTRPPDDPWAWAAPYEIITIRDLIGDTDSDTDGYVPEVNESVGKAWLYAGSWKNLNQALPSGTWYSSAPVEVAIDGGTVSADTLMLDAYAPLVIGYELDETEPNDLPEDEEGEWITPIDPANANNGGVLSGAGVVDIFRGTLDFKSADAGYVHEQDAFAVTFPSELVVTMQLSWGDDSDIDVYLLDENAEIWEASAGYDNPEVSEPAGTVLPDTQYYLVVIGYLGPAGGSAASVPYELRIEQAAP